MISNHKAEKLKIKQRLMAQFDMKDLKPPHHFLDMRKDGKFIIKQSGKIQRVLERFKMSDCKSAHTPMDSGVKLIESDCKRDNLPYRKMLGCYEAFYISMYSLHQTRYFPCKQID